MPTTRHLFLLIVCTLIWSFGVSAQNNTGYNTGAETEPDDYEDIGVFLMVQNVGGYEIDAIYMDDNIYVDVATLFGILKINHQLSQGNDSIVGFFLNEENRYSINLKNNTAKVGNLVRKLKPDEALRTELGLYLKNTLYGELFGLHLKFNFRSLSLELTTIHELPVIKELRLEQMRKNVDRLSGVVEVDTTLRRKYHVLRGGMIDWAVNSMQISNQTTDTRLMLGASTELLGGEATAQINYSTETGFDERQQQYRWRWVNNESKLVKQVQAGKIPVRATSSLYAPYTGVSVSNTPVSFRKSYGSYTLADYTEPGWTVELYVNNVIVDYTTADASGFFSFEVPLVYGLSVVTLKFYGPWGEERIREETINIPYNFVPKGKVEYNLTSGLVNDTVNSLFSRAETMFGINKSLTVGAGLEYFSALSTNQAMPFVTASARFLQNFLFTADYTHGVKAHGLLTWRLPSNLSFEVDYTKYKEGQKAISFNYLEERRISLSMPFTTAGLRSFARMSYKQNILPLTTYSSAELLLSTFFKGVSTNLATYGNWVKEGTPYLYSNLSLGFKVAKSITIRPQAQFNITRGNLVSVRTEIEKSFSRIAHLSVMYEENIRSNYRSFEFTFRYDLPFAQTAASSRVTGKQVTTNQSARGSFAFGSGNGYVHADNRNAVNKAGLTIIPFLDLNNDDMMNNNEPIASGLMVRLNGGRLIKQNKDSLIRVIELEPYISYLLEIEDTGFENIAWQLDQKTISIMVDPSQFKRVEIPVKVMGEANGIVSVRKGGRLQGQGRIIINFINSKGEVFNRTLSESDGYFNFLGLPPGEYIAMPDTAQLNKLNYKATPESFEFSIREDIYGDIIDDINFILEPLTIREEEAEEAEAEIQGTSEIKEPVQKESSPDLREIKTESSIKVEPSKTSISSQPIWYVQAGAYIKRYNADAMAQKLQEMGYNTIIVNENNLLNVRIHTTSKQEARSIYNRIISAGISAFIDKEQ